MLQAVKAGDLKRAMAIQARIDPLKTRSMAAASRPGEAHANMKAAMVAAGIFERYHAAADDRPDRKELAQIAAAVVARV